MRGRSRPLLADRRRRALALVALTLTASTAPLVSAPPALAAAPASVRMDGGSSMITVPDSTGLRRASNFTLEARAKPLAAARATTIFGKSFYELSMFPAQGGVLFALVVRQGTWREARSRGTTPV